MRRRVRVTDWSCKVSAPLKEDKRRTVFGLQVSVVDPVRMHVFEAAQNLLQDGANFGIRRRGSVLLVALLPLEQVAAAHELEHEKAPVVFAANHLHHPHNVGVRLEARHALELAEPH